MYLYVQLQTYSCSALNVFLFYEVRQFPLKNDTKMRKLDMAKTARYELRMTEKQKATIKNKADSMGMTMPDFLITLGMGYEPRPRPNTEYIKKLAQLNADMNRFGNLLKMWITRDGRLFGSYSEEQIDQEVLPKLMDKVNGILVDLKISLDEHLNRKNDKI